MEFFDVELLTFGLLDHIAQFQHFQHSNQICSGLAGVGDIAVDLSLGGPGWKARIFHEECDGPVEIPPKGVDSGVDNSRAARNASYANAPGYPNVDVNIPFWRITYYYCALIF